MTGSRFSRRMVLLFAAGGCLLQVAGCVSGIGPVLISFAESALVSYILGGLASL